jgi:type 1 glutamine amidotransferase
MRQHLGWAALFAVLGLGTAGFAQEKAGSTIRVVIIDGQNNHAWKATTPVLKKALEDCGRFRVDVATTPEKPRQPQQPKEPKEPLLKSKEPTTKDEANYKAELAKYKNDLAKYPAALAAYKEDLAKYPAAQAAYKEAMPKFRIDFSKYDVVVSNYNGESWPKEVNDSLDEALKSGKIGLVIVHAANNAFGGWSDYNRMIGMGWRGKKQGDRLYLDDMGKTVRVPSGSDQDSGHRYTGKFEVTLRDPEHPITRGMPSLWLHNNDELYDNMRGPIENIHMLATAFSPGTKVHEPMIWTVSYGKGRVFHTPMGHDVNAMRCVGFITTLQRGTEWAATGQVSLPIPANFPTAKQVSTVPAN